MPEQVPKKSKRFRSLTATIAVAFLGLSVGMLFFSMALEIYLSFRSQRDVVEDRQTLIAQGAANQVSGYIQNVANLLTEAGSISSLAKLDAKEQELVLSKLIGRNPSFRHLYVLDLQGEKLSSVSRVSDPQGGYESVAADVREDLLESAGKGEVFISSVRVDDRTNEPLILLAVPIEDSFHVVQGALVADVNLKFMWDLVSNIRVGDGGQAYVVDEKGNLIAYSDTSRVLSRENLSSLYEVSEFVHGEDVDDDGSELQTGIDGQRVVSTFVALGTPNWAVIVEMPIFEAYSSVILLMFESLLIILLSAVLAVVTALFLSRHITKGIVELSTAADEISRGNLNTRISITSDNEIGRLAESFNSMTSKLKESYQTLEKKVEERTTELDSKVAEFERMNRLMVDRELKMIELKKELESQKSNKSQ